MIRVASVSGDQGGARGRAGGDGKRASAVVLPREDEKYSGYSFSATSNAWQHEDQKLSVVSLAGK